MRPRETCKSYRDEFLILHFTAGKQKITSASGTPSRMFSISRCTVLPTFVTSASFLLINYEILSLTHGKTQAPVVRMHD